MKTWYEENEEKIIVTLMNLMTLISVLFIGLAVRDVMTSWDWKTRAIMYVAGYVFEFWALREGYRMYKEGKEV